MRPCEERWLHPAFGTELREAAVPALHKTSASGRYLWQPPLGIPRVQSSYLRSFGRHGMSFRDEERVSQNHQGERGGEGARGDVLRPPPVRPCLIQEEAWSTCAGREEGRIDPIRLHLEQRLKLRRKLSAIPKACNGDTGDAPRPVRREKSVPGRTDASFHRDSPGDCPRSVGARVGQRHHGAKERLDLVRECLDVTPEAPVAGSSSAGSTASPLVVGNQSGDGARRTISP